MFDRSLWNALMLIGIALPIAGCTSSGGLDSIQVTPTTASLVVGGPTLQMTATGTYGNSAHPSTSVITNQVTWTSAITGVATVNSSGVVTAVGGGTTTITATAQGFAGPVSSSAAITVTGTGSIGEPITALSIVPASQSVALAGQTSQFLAIGTTGTGLQVNLTTSVAWTSSNASVATISATGLATAVGPGASTITAIATNPDKTVVTATGTFTVSGVTSEPLISLAITPSSQTVAKAGQTAQFIAIGTFSPASSTPGTRDLTTSVTWTTSSSSVATITKNGGLATAVGPGTTVVMAEATNPDGSVVTQTATLTVTGTGTTSTEPLASLAIVPTSQSALAVNQTANFLAIGTTGSGTTVNLTNQGATINGSTVNAAVWSSSNPTVATVNPATGVATALSAGATAIVAIATNPDGSVVTAAAVFTVTVPSQTEAYVSLAIVPTTQTVTAVNQVAQFIAIGTTGTGTTVNLTGVATWTSSSPAVATISGPGQATALTNGVSAITAVVKNPSNDGTVVTASAVLTVAIAGSTEPLISLEILPSTQTVASAGQTTQFLAIGTFSATSSTPGTQNMANVPTYTVTWYSSNPSVATINSSTGVATGVGPGTTAITAIATNNADKSGMTAAASFTVTGPAAEPISALSIFPGTQSITLPLAGSPLQTAAYIAIGTNGSTGLQSNVTSQVAWSSSNPQVAMIGSTGVATALSQGTTTIMAIATNPDKSVVTATATLTVSGIASEPLLSLQILPTSQSVASPNQTAQFTAIGTFSTSPVTQNLTNNNTTFPIRWSSSDTSVATVGSPEKVGTIPGLVTGVGQGTAAITAIATNPDGSVVTGIATFMVISGTVEPITALAIYPSSLALSATGQTGQFMAVGTSGVTGLNIDVTNSTQLKWVSSIPTIATITSGLVTGNGLAAGVSPGTSSITATWTNPDNSVVTATATVTVSVTAQPEPLLAITIVPDAITVGNLQLTGQFLAFGTFSTDPTVMDITNGFTHAGFNGEVPVTWISSAPELFPVNTTGAAGEPAGVVTALGTGNAVILAEATNTDGTVVTGSGTFACVPPTGTYCEPAQTELSTLTIYNAGLNTTTWLVTAPSATGTQDVIHCGPGSEGAGLGSPVCNATYPEGTTVTLTAPAGTGLFGGWSSNCTPIIAINQNGPNSCQVTLTTNDTVGAIFN